MLVRARYVRRDDLPADLRTPWILRGFNTDGIHRGLRVGAEYVVYAEQTTPEGVLYFIADGAGPSWYPFAYVAELFELVDARISRTWVPAGAGAVRSFAAWATDPDFYSNLQDPEDDGAALEIYARQQAIMDWELVVPSKVEAVGKHAGEGWVECTACDYVWNEPAALVDEMCRCRNCRRVLGLRA